MFLLKVYSLNDYFYESFKNLRELKEFLVWVDQQESVSDFEVYRCKKIELEV